MGDFLSTMIASFQSGTAEGVSIAFFDFSFLLFVISSVGYGVHLLRRTQGPWLVGFGALCVGIATMTLALALRWIAAGWAHPPWTNLYESLVFFSWGLNLSYIVMELKYRVRVAGAFIVPIAMIGMGIASMTGNKEISPLMPALQSIWLHLHVCSASIGYAMFIVAFGFAILYLFRDGLPMPFFHMASAVFSILSIVAVTKFRVFLLSYPLSKGVLHNGEIFKATIPGTDPQQFYQIELPGLGIFLFITMFLFGVSAVISYRAAEKGTQGERRSFFALLLPMILFLFALFQLVHESGSTPGFYLKLNGYAFALMAFSWFLGLASLMLSLGGEGLREHLPAARTLDRLTYKSIMVAFPILFFVIVSGAIWANEAWGRYWGWDPKETSSLVTLIVYLIYLHTRVTKGWMGRRTAYIAIAGFASVVFTYLGVNLVISGLHSYAAG